MTLSEKLASIQTLFLDTAPIIYYIEAHPQFGPLARQAVNAFQSGGLQAYSSTITLVEVLPKPIEIGDMALANQFIAFLRHGKNISLLEISADIGEVAGKLRGKYPALRTMDAIQIAVAIDISADAFLTNDRRLKSVKEIDVIVLKDYLP
jgi:predicted nucleic acid-binding protein